ncbi:MAG: GGDEF domain-containing protein, partial [bacterium]|nr:GGDEF domain-containing protein [bacterium]
MDVARVSSSDDEQRLLVVYAIQRLLALAPDEETLLRECCALLAQYRHYRLVWSGFAEPGGAIRIVASSGAARHYLDGVEPRWDDTLAGRGNAGWVIRRGQSRVVRIPGPWNLALGARARAFGIASLLTLPLRIEGSVVGVIAAYSDEVDGFEEKESRLLEGLADDIARALQLLRVRASAADEMARSRDRLRRLEAVRRLFADIGGEIDARRTVLLDEGARALGMDVAVVGSVEGDLLRYQLMVLDNVASHPGSLIPLERTVGGIAIAERRTCSWQDLAAEPGLEAEMNLRARGYRCALATPFEVDGRFFALAFAAHAAREDPFAEEDHVYVELLASLFAQFMRDNRQQEQIRDLRTLDQLTGLPNRANFEMRLAEATSARDAQQRPFAVIGLDLDRFRGINTALGFAIGDRLLVQTAERLRSVLREGDVLARTGGDGFGIIAEARTPEAAADIATRLSNRLA